MKTAELLNKYQTYLAGILRCDISSIKFFINKHEIKEIEYFEPEKDEFGYETGEQIRNTRWTNWSEGNYLVYQDKKLISSFELYKMPHCCAILVSCKASVEKSFQNMRIGTLLNNFRQDIGRILGYSLLLCTDIEQNINQRKLLQTNSWKDIYSIINKRTNNKVFISCINL